MPTKQLPPLTARQIELMWHDTFSTNNPFCPCDLKSFTKTVRATEGALAALLQAAPTEPAAPAVQVQPTEPGWYVVTAPHLKEPMVRAFGKDGQWWIPLGRGDGMDGWMTAPEGYKWFGPIADVDATQPFLSATSAAQPEQPGDHVSRAVPTKDATGATSDRELLELAARAAGISVGTGAEARFIGEHASLYFHNDSRNHPMCRPGTPPGNVPWNPLADDGDAFRLAVRLRLNVEHIGAYSQAGFRSKEPAPSGTCAHGNDPYAATRRAVVRAAAQVEAQPEARKQNES